MKKMDAKKNVLEAIMGDMDETASKGFGKGPAVVAEIEVEKAPDTMAVAEEIYSVATDASMEKDAIIAKIAELIDSKK